MCSGVSGLKGLYLRLYSKRFIWTDSSRVENSLTVVLQSRPAHTKSLSQHLCHDVDALDAGYMAYHGVKLVI